MSVLKKAIVKFEDIRPYCFFQIPGTREIDAVFQKGAYTEATLCHADHHWLMNYSSVCNLTQENDGMSWFCGKPTNKKLSCKDWSFTKYASKYAVLPLTKAEEQMFKYVFACQK